jgi:hypothetical protein
MYVPPACQNIADKIKALQTKKNDLSEQLKSVPTNQKPPIAAQINELNKQIAQKQKELNACIAAHPLEGAFLLAYKAAAGTVALDNVHTTMDGTSEVWRDSWSVGWTTIVPFRMDTKDCLLEYKWADGTVVIDAFRSDLSTEEFFRDTWSAGWTNIVPFEVFGQVHLFKYRATDGKFRIDTVHSDLGGIDQGSLGSWKPGWQNIGAFPHGAETCLLSSHKDGMVAIDGFTPGLQDTQEKHHESWGTGWTSVFPFSLNTDVYAFGYKSGDGTVRIKKIRPDLTGMDATWNSSWTKGWDMMFPFMVGGDVFIFMHKTDGTVAIDKVRANAQGTDEKFRRPWSTGWTTVVHALTR